MIQTTLPRLRVREDAAYGARLITLDPVRAGDLVAPIGRGRLVDSPSYRSIQVGPSGHLEDLANLQYLNHSCAPSVIVDVERRAVIAARDLAPGDELTYFYPSTEWDMARPFTCLCGAPGCLGTISGAKDVDADVLHRYALSPHIRLRRPPPARC